jgi:DivIVA domain-containing protein
VFNSEIELSSQDILSKEFKIDTRGYRPQEVDKFLDTIIRDYETFNRLLKIASNERQELVDENISLKQEVRNLKAKLEVLASNSDNSTSTADVLRRLSNLEKIVYDNEKE